jgi:hypothetical protein
MGKKYQGKNEGPEEWCGGRQVGDWKGLHERMKFVRITEGTFIYKIDCIDFHYVNCINCTVCTLSLPLRYFFPMLLISSWSQTTFVKISEKNKSINRYKARIHQREKTFFWYSIPLHHPIIHPSPSTDKTPDSSRIPPMKTMK